MSSDFALFFCIFKKILQQKQPDTVCQIVFVSQGTKNYAKCLFLYAFIQMYFSSKNKFSFIHCRNKIVQITYGNELLKNYKKFIYAILKNNICFGTSKDFLRTRVRPKLFAKGKNFAFGRNSKNSAVKRSFL